ncbi:transmembrane protein 62-like [Styela clava]
MGPLRTIFQLPILLVTVVCVIVSTYILYNPVVTPSNQWRSMNEPYPKDTTDNLFWFVQVSDIHISKFWELERGPEFKDFCTTTLGIIKPGVVLVTGDLTDAKSKNKVDSEQYEEEWKTYSKIIEETKVTEKYVWLDIRGNHDAFDVSKINDPKSNPYLKYSGDKGKLSSNVYKIIKPYGTYSFIPVDATMIPGPRRPYNFAGYLTEERMKKLEKFKLETAGSNSTIWYSHYPTSSITSASPGIANLVGQRGGVYLSGHLHKLQGLADTLYAVNGKGFLELELGDWRSNRMYRILAIDHDMISFTDLRYNQWPAIVLTNPKNSKFMMPNTEPMGRISKSSHIRFLIFDPWQIEKVEVKIDGKLLADTAYQVQGSSLWVCRWDTGLYKTGTHGISITVADSQGNKKTLNQQFSLDSTWELYFDHVAAFVLLTDFSTLFFYGFCAVSLCYIISILIMRFHHCDSTSILMVTKCNVLMRDDHFYYGAMLFAVNLICGPWFVGELLRGNIGICFSFGLLINGDILSECMLYLQGVIKVVVFYFPALLFLAHFNHAVDNKGKNNLQNFSRTWKSLLLLSFYFLYISMHLYSCFGIYQAYGSMAGLVSPASLWWLLFVLHKTLSIYNHKYNHAKH